MDKFDRAIKVMRYLEAETGVEIDNDHQPERWDGLPNICCCFIKSVLMAQRDNDEIHPIAESFVHRYPDCNSIARLHTLLSSLSNEEIAREALNYGWKNGFNPKNPRPQQLKDLVSAFLEYIENNNLEGLSEKEAIEYWGRNTPDGKKNPLAVKHVGPKTISWLKTYAALVPEIMSDVHVTRGVIEILGLEWRDIPELCNRLDIADYQLDQFFIWIKQEGNNIRELMKDYKD